MFNNLRHLADQNVMFQFKMNVLHIMGMTIDKMSILMTIEYADKLIQYLPMLWDESRDHNLLRCAIISILVGCSLNFFPKLNLTYDFFFNNFRRK